jgi:hypothetical protein
MLKTDKALIKKAAEIICCSILSLTGNIADVIIFN